MKRILIFTTLVLVVAMAAPNASAFDGLRRGFVLGGGLGFAPVSSWDTDLEGFNESQVGVGVHIFLGYAWDEYNMIVYEGNGTGFKSDFGDADIIQMFNGAAWYHYFGPVGKSAFTTVGVGVFSFDFEFNDVWGSGYSISGSNDPGPGFLVGAGYEFARHFQAGVYVGVGRTSEPGLDYTHVNLSVLVSGAAF